MAKKPKNADQKETIIAIKGFNRDLTCRGFQFKEGETFKHDGDVEACQSGFHAIEGHPLEVFTYYAPGLSVYHDVELRGPFARHSADSKIAAAEITIKAEVKIPELVSRAVKWVMDRATIEEGGHATGDQGAASATGYHGAAMAAGYAGEVSGSEGNALFAIERGEWDGRGCPIISVASGIVGKDGVKPDTWYVAKAGKLVAA